MKFQEKNYSIYAKRVNEAIKKKVKRNPYDKDGKRA